MSEHHLPITKFTIPPVRAQVLARTSLIERLTRSATLPLTLLSTGAGFGKTTLLAVWASQHPQLVAWLSLEPLDNDLLRFWSAVLAALRLRFPDAVETAQTQLHA